MVGKFFNARVKQHISGSVQFATTLGDIRDAGDVLPFEPLLEGINVNLDVEFWSRLDDFIMKILESEDSNDREAFWLPLLYGASFKLKLGSAKDIPDEVKNGLREMAGFIPRANILFDQMLPALRGQAEENMPQSVK